MDEDLKPCPFCGGRDLIGSTLCNDDGEIDGVYCKGCTAEAPLAVWNQRAGATVCAG